MGPAARGKCGYECDMKHRRRRRQSARIPVERRERVNLFRHPCRSGWCRRSRRPHASAEPGWCCFPWRRDCLVPREEFVGLHPPAGIDCNWHRCHHLRHCGWICPRGRPGVVRSRVNPRSEGIWSRILASGSRRSGTPVRRESLEESHHDHGIADMRKAEPGSR